MIIAVIDIDGTVANNDHRAHHVDRKEGDDRPKDWEAFLQPHLVAKDTVVEGARKAIDHMKQLGWRFIFLTGRREELRKTTDAWIKEHLEIDLTEDQLIMRPVGNMMKPTEYKGQQLQTLKSENPGASFVFFDDDKFMWKIYAEYGLVLQAPECWNVVFPHTTEEEPSNIWRK